jgi:polysaccharide deacetylase family protein (PEP-CTERM system associated)
MTVDNILTVDLEDWFHICGVQQVLPRSGWNALASRIVKNTHRILELLDRCSARATFFVLGSVARKHPALVATIQAAGHEIASHGDVHRRVYTMTPDEFRQDLRRSAASISLATGNPVTGYRAAEWSIRDDSLWALDILAEEGFTWDASMAPFPIIGNEAYPTRPHRLRLAAGDLLEIPPLALVTPLVNLPVGGGWGLRTLPYGRIREIVRRYNREGDPALFFVHPREFDPSPPRVPLPLVKRLVLEARIETTERRLKRLLADFRFVPLSEAMVGVKMKVEGGR